MKYCNNLLWSIIIAIFIIRRLLQSIFNWLYFHVDSWISTGRTTRVRSTEILLPPRISKYRNRRLQKYRVMYIASATIFGAKDIRANDDTNGENRPPNWLALMVSTSERRRENKNARTTILWALVDLSTAWKTPCHKTHPSSKKMRRTNSFVALC